MYIWEKRYNTAMLYRYPKSKKYPYEIPTKSGFFLFFNNVIAFIFVFDKNKLIFI